MFTFCHFLIYFFHTTFIAFSQSRHAMIPRVQENAMYTLHNFRPCFSTSERFAQSFAFLIFLAPNGVIFCPFLPFSTLFTFSRASDRVNHGNSGPPPHSVLSTRIQMANASLPRRITPQKGCDLPNSRPPSSRQTARLGHFVTVPCRAVTPPTTGRKPRFRLRLHGSPASGIPPALADSPIRLRQSVPRSSESPIRKEGQQPATTRATPYKLFLSGGEQRSTPCPIESIPPPHSRAPFQ